MCRRFYDVSGYAEMGEFDPERMESVLDQLIDARSLLVADGAMLGWVNFPVFMTGQQVSQELFWWVDEDKRGTGLGKDILDAAHVLCKESGSSHMMMLCLDDLEGERVAGMLKSMGYRSRERTYMRVL